MSTLKRKRSPSASPIRSRSISALTEPTEVYEDSPRTIPIPEKKIITPQEYVYGEWRYVQSMGTRGEHLDKERLNKILKRMETEPIKTACETDESLKNLCDAIHNKIRDLTENWSKSKLGSINGGKRTRRSKTMRKKRRSSRKNKNNKK